MKLLLLSAILIAYGLTDTSAKSQPGPDDCPGEEVYTSTGNANCKKTCSEPNGPPCPKITVPGCMCPRDKPISQGGGKCGTLDDCEKEPECQGNLIYNKTEGLCVQYCGMEVEICAMTQGPGCICPEDKPITIAYNKCGTLDDCPQETKCPGEREFDKCSAHCVATCDNPEGHLVCDKSCRHPGCKCPAKTPIYFGYNQCGTIEDCKACEGQQVWNDKASACDKTCDDPEPACTKNIVQRCECPSGTPILANPGNDVYPRCIKIDECGQVEQSQEQQSQEQQSQEQQSQEQQSQEQQSQEQQSQEEQQQKQEKQEQLKDLLRRLLNIQ